MTPDSDMFSCRAAIVKLPCSATAQKYLRCHSSTLKGQYHHFVLSLFLIDASKTNGATYGVDRAQIDRSQDRRRRGHLDALSGSWDRWLCDVTQ
jgi:hypothetical protein